MQTVILPYVQTVTLVDKTRGYAHDMTTLMAHIPRATGPTADAASGRHIT